MLLFWWKFFLEFFNFAEFLYKFPETLKFHIIILFLKKISQIFILEYFSDAKKIYIFQ